MQNRSVLDRSLNWITMFTLVLAIPFMMTYGASWQVWIHARAFVMCLGLASTLTLFFALGVAEHLKKAASGRWLLLAFASLGLTFVPLFLGPPGTLAAPEPLLLTGLAAIFIMTLFFTSLWWGAEIMEVPTALTLLVCTTHIGLLTWAALSHSLLPDIIAALCPLAAASAWSYRNVQLVKRAFHSQS